MKYFFKTMTFVVSTMLLLTSCQTNEAEELEQKINLSFSKTSASLTEIIRKSSKTNDIISKINFSFSKSNESIDFDFNNPISYFNSNGEETIIVNQVGLDVNNDVNYALTYKNQDNLFQFLIVKTISEPNGVKKVENYNFDGELIYISLFDPNTEQVSVTLPNRMLTYNHETRDCEYNCDDSLGENTAACLEDVYSNHGWLSVWATVQSAFIPQTAAALAAACAADAATDDCCSSDYTPVNNNN